MPEVAVDEQDESSDAEQEVDPSDPPVEVADIDLTVRRGKPSVDDDLLHTSFEVTLRRSVPNRAFGEDLGPSQ